MPALAYIGMVIAATVAAARLAPRGVGGFTAALAVTLLTTFAFGKKAFCNYYVFVIAVLAMAIAMARLREPLGRPSDAGAPAGGVTPA